MRPRFGTRTANVARNVAAILASAHDFQVCEGCEGVVHRACVRCCLCNAYRFDTSPDRVRRRAKAIGRRRPEPLTSQPIEEE